MPVVLAHVSFKTKYIYSGFPRSGKSQGKTKKVQGQGKVREFCFWSGKFEILAKVREKSGKSQGILESKVRPYFSVMIITVLNQ